MPTITRLQAQRRHPDRISVHVDDEYAFSLPVDVAAALTTGQELSDDELDELRMESGFRRGLDRAVRFLAYRPRSRVEVARYLGDREVDEATTQLILERLTEIGVVDDAAFAAWWVENRSTHRPRGRFALRSELTSRGVDRATIAAALEDVDEDELAQRVALDKASRYAGQPRDVFHRRMAALLTRRGFGASSVHGAVQAAWRAATESEPRDAL